MVKLNPSKKEQPAAFKAVNYIGMIPVLTEAIQEQQMQLEALQGKYVDLKEQFDDLKVLVRSLSEGHH